MLITEKIEREFTELLEVHLTQVEQDRLRSLLDEWGADPDIGMPLYAELSEDVGETMRVSRSEAHVINGILETEEDLHMGPLWQKFAEVCDNKILPS